MRFKRIISFLMTIFIICAEMIYVGAAEPETANTLTLYDIMPHENTEEITWLESADFEDKKKKVLGLDIQSSVVKSEDEHNEVFEVASNGTRFFELPEVIDKGIVVVDFDIYNITSGLAYFRPCNAKASSMADTANFGEALVFTSDIGWYPNTAGWTPNMVRNLSDNAWHNVSMWFDIDYHKAYYVMDNEYLGSTDLNESHFPDLKKLWLIVEQGAQFRLDNMRVFRVERTLFEKVAEKGVTIPDDFFINYSVKANIGELGNAVYEKNVSIPAEIEIINKLIVDSNIKVIFYVKDRETKEVLWSTERTMNVHPGENDLSIDLPGMEKYGYLDLQTDIYDASSGKFQVSTLTPYAFVNLPDSGDYNKHMGICLHARFIGTHDDAPINLDFASRAGFFSTRGEHAWDSYELDPGVYKLHSLFEEYLKKTRELGMEHYHILVYRNDLYADGNPSTPVLSDKSHKAFGQYAVNMIEDLMDRLGNGAQEVELFNEWNNEGSWFNNCNATPEDYAHFASIVYPIIKEKYPNVFVWGCSTVGIGNAWIERVLAAGGGEYMDGITVHPYSFTSSPEAGGQKAGIEELKAILKKYGYENMPLCASEWGWASVGEGGYPDEVGQASYLVRFSAMDLTYNWFDSTYWYEINDEGVVNTQEQRFGLVRDDKAEIPFGLKPAYLAAATWNKTMNEAAAEGEFKLSETAVGHRFKLRDGRNCMVAWTPSDKNETVSVDLGCDSVTLMDMYGNETVLYSDDGRINLYLDSNPVYIMGSFSKYESASPSFTAKTDTVNALQKDIFTYSFSRNSEKEYTYRVKETADIKLTEHNSANGVETFIFNQNGEEPESETLYIEIYDGDRLVGYIRPKVRYTKVAELNMYIRPQSVDNTDWWQVYLDIKNNSMKETLTGKLKVLSPKEFSESAGETVIREISPLNSNRLKLNIPKMMIERGSITKIKLLAEFSNGETLEQEGNTSFELCGYAENKPEIDGVIKKGEYVEDAAIDLSKGTYKYLAGNAYEGEQDLTGRFFTTWDEENYYFAAEIYDDENSYDVINGGVLWRSDGIQFAMAKYAGSSELVQLDMAKVAGKNLLEIDRSSTGAQTGIVPEDKYRLEIKTEGNITTYELMLPWSTIYPKGTSIEKNGEFAFTMLVNDNDKGVREGYLEYGSGMGSGSANTSQYKTFFMHGKSLIEDLK